MADHWFTPKPRGYGARPANWKGWAAVAGFIGALLVLSVAVFTGLGVVGVSVAAQNMVYLLSAIVLTLGFFALAKRKTNGDWKWR